MKLLILGGTRFVGRHLVEAAHARGHRVTLFNRGARPDLFPDVERRTGDRLRGDLAALDGGHWDAAVDTCGYVPAHVRATAARLAGAVGHYTFVSTLSVYAEDAAIPVAESGALAQATPDELARAETIVPAGPVVAEAYGDLYGALKAACEREAAQAAGGRALIVRPGLVAGPHDYTDRFGYWPARVARGGEVLAPGAPDRPLQLIDARDLAEWIVRLVEEGRTGTFNATGPAAPLTLGHLLDECRAVTGGDARFTWVSDEHLLAAGVVPWSELPLWVPGPFVAAPAINADCRSAIAAGLRFRPLRDTIRDTLDWDRARPAGEPRRAGLAPARERDLLRAWSALQERQ